MFSSIGMDIAQQRIRECIETKSNKLDLSGLGLTLLPELPAGLDELYCSFNQLTSLPELPAGLTELYCYDNQ